MNQLVFENGDKLDAIGLGTWKSEPEKVEHAVKYALETGYRHIDCAKSYANEKAVGRAFSTAFSEGNIKRDDIWITSKLWNNAHKEKDVIPALKQTLKDLQTDYLDLYLIHWPVAFKPGIDNFPKTDDDYLSLEEAPIIETWNKMLEAKKQGLVKHLGVSNFSIKKLQKLTKQADDMPEMLQVEMHPYLPQPDLLDYCREKEMNITAYSPLGSGDRAKGMKADNEPNLLQDETIAKIAEKHQCNPGQVLIKWAEKRGTAVIPKSTTEKHIKMNLKSTELNLDDDDLQAISDIDIRFRYVDGEFFVTPGNPYANIFDL
jgi:alcohol dehydrogenase (NADP+)